MGELKAEILYPKKILDCRFLNFYVVKTQNVGVKTFTEIDEEIKNSISLTRDVWEDEISGMFDKEMKGKLSRSSVFIHKWRIKILVKTMKMMKQKLNEPWTHYKFTVDFRIIIQAAKGYWL